VRLDPASLADSRPTRTERSPPPSPGRVSRCRRCVGAPTTRPGTRRGRGRGQAQRCDRRHGCRQPSASCSLLPPSVYMSVGAVSQMNRSGERRLRWCGTSWRGARPPSPGTTDAASSASSSARPTNELSPGALQSGLPRRVLAASESPASYWPSPGERNVGQARRRASPKHRSLAAGRKRTDRRTKNPAARRVQIDQFGTQLRQPTASRAAIISAAMGAGGNGWRVRPVTGRLASARTIAAATGA